MSTSLKIVLLIIAFGVVGGVYMLKKNEALFQAELSPHQDLSTMMNTGQVELKTFAAWCAEQGHQDQALEACIAKRKARAAQLLDLEKSASSVDQPSSKLGESERVDKPTKEAQNSASLDLVQE